MVAPAVAVAAKHVVEPEIEMLMQGRVAGYVVAVAPWGPEIWQPDRITALHHTDLVLITLRRASALPEDNTLRHVQVSTQVPDVGTPIMIVGFGASAASFSVDPPVFDGQIHAAIGEVTAHYPHGRDSVMVPWPSIEVSVDTLRGMSGGPAFDRDGRFIGVLSSGMTSPDGRGPSYVSVIHPALDEAFHAPFINQNASLRDVTRRIGSLFDAG